MLRDKALYLEGDGRRFEVYCSLSDKTFSFGEVHEPQSKCCEFMRTSRVPLEEEHVGNLFRGLEWSEFEWGERSLKVRDFEVRTLKGYMFYPRNRFP